MDLKKHYRRRMKRFQKSLHAPFEKYKALQKLWQLMGAQGVLLHMAKQGRWNPTYTFFGGIISISLLMFSLSVVSNADGVWWSWVFALPAVVMTAFVHYALWRATSNMRPGKWATTLRFYAIPVLTLIFFIVVGLMAVLLKDFMAVISDGLKQISASTIQQ